MSDCNHDWKVMRVLRVVCARCGLNRETERIAELEVQAHNRNEHISDLEAENKALREAVGNLLNDNAPANREAVYALLKQGGE